MSDYHPLEDPDYYTKRSRSLMQDDYPLEVSRLVFSETDPLLIRWHWHEEVEIEYIVSGQIYITCEEETILASQGDLVFINQNVRHFVTPASEEHVPFILSLSIPLFSGIWTAGTGEEIYYAGAP